VVAFGLFNEEMGTEDVVIIAETELSEPEERGRIAQAVQQKVARGSAVAVRHVRLVDRHWLIKTSSGKIACSANRERYVTEHGG
jgi:fatty-acyl-CoA synthase